MRLSEMASALGCPPPSRDVTVEAVVTDSRKVDFGALFAALPGAQVDGHDFAPAAVELGAVALLVKRRLELDVPQLVVDDVLLALGRLAALLRRRLDPQVVGITGSNGKTTVKEMVACILRGQAPLLVTQGNYNNELGVPLTLFRLEPKHQYAVLELGASRQGDIAYLAGIAQPDVAVVTNIGPAHLGGFGSLEGTARGKGEIFAALPAEGCAVINADEPWRDLWLGLNRADRVLTFGTAPGSDVRIAGDDRRPRLETREGGFDLQLALPGHHNLLNAAAATAVGLALGVSLERIREGLKAVQPVPGRLNFIDTDSGWTVIDDTYNANPASLYSALQVLSDMQGTAWLVLGDMKELGPESAKMHREVGDAARAMGVQRLFTVGEMAAFATDAFGEGAQHFDSREQLIAALQACLHPGLNCLVKGSRSMGMEAVVQAIAAANAMREVG